MTNQAYWVWFQLVFGIGTRRAELFLHYFSHPGEILDGLRSGGQVTAMLTAKERSLSVLCQEKAENICARTLKKGCDIITPDHPLYPSRLRYIYSHPAALYVKGDLSCLADSLCIGMVGTRKHSAYGERAAWEISRGLAASGAVIVSGLAKGIDTICHSAALEAGGKTIGVLGCGIDVDYPKGSGVLKRAMSQNGAVVTEYPLGMPPISPHFPVRNRLVSGMSHGVVVVEANLRSGSLITANHALEQGRDVFAVPGDIFSGCSKGCNKLIGEGARIVTTAADVWAEYKEFTAEKPVEHMYKFEQMGFSINNAPANEEMPLSQKQPLPLPQELGESARLIYEQIHSDPVSIDEIAAQVDLEIGIILSALTELEIYGLIQGYPGRRFSLV
ncbi:DNA-processing protein DprA [Oscillospiraceae bacterium MB08-C2-2]|nr:DNA-processing protein DprA [Oscillospiraceae bacterium MB08-C2-2]